MTASKSRSSWVSSEFFVVNHGRNKQSLNGLYGVVTPYIESELGCFRFLNNQHANSR